jgi:hypothetical protein
VVSQKQGIAAGKAHRFHGCACGSCFSGTNNSGED